MYEQKTNAYVQDLMQDEGHAKRDHDELLREAAKFKLQYDLDHAYTCSYIFTAVFFALAAYNVIALLRLIFLYSEVSYGGLNRVFSLITEQALDSDLDDSFEVFPNWLGILCSLGFLTTHFLLFYTCTKGISIQKALDYQNLMEHATDIKPLSDDVLDYHLQRVVNVAKISILI